jgi:hypothetical protein
LSQSGSFAGEECAAVSVLTPEPVEQYRQFDSASVSNAIEAFEVRLRNEGFADALFGDAGGLLLPPALVSQIPDTMDSMHWKEAPGIAFCRSARFSIDGLRTLVRELG